MRDLSIVIPARNEMFLQKTIDDALENIEADTEIIAICDGYVPNPPIQIDDRVRVYYFHEPVGQRASTNAGVRLSEAKYIMKVDAHCAFGKGFDRILMEDCKPDWTMVPMMWNLHAFDWECKGCGERTYQGIKPERCEKCSHTEHGMVLVWKPRGNKVTISWRFDSNLQFQYWRSHRKRPEAKGELIETMSCIGCCFFMERERFWEIEGLDENHGSWGQFGTEIACKSWLSGGKLITSKKTWMGHLFRTGNFKGSGWNGSSFPYQLGQNQIDHARAYSRDLWLNNKWHKQIHPLKWLVDKFSPVPGWEGFEWKSSA